MVSTDGICVDDYGVWRGIGGWKILDRFPSTNYYDVGIYMAGGRECIDDGAQPVEDTGLKPVAETSFGAIMVGSGSLCNKIFPTSRVLVPSIAWNYSFEWIGWLVFDVRLSWKLS